jgi:hypothetical protein
MIIGIRSNNIQETTEVKTKVQEAQQKKSIVIDFPLLTGTEMMIGFRSPQAGRKTPHWIWDQP